jgi:CAAX protease family protein
MASLDRESRRVGADLGLFFGATFGLSWLLWGAALLSGGTLDQPLPYVLFVVGAFGPTIAAAVLWLAGLRRRRGCNPIRTVHRWLLPALLLGAAPAVTAAVLIGPVELTAAARQVAATGGPPAIAAYILFTGPLSEEFGWRGYAQPRLRRRLSPGATALVLGLAWGMWHLPLFLLRGTAQSQLGLFGWQALLFFVAFVPLSYTIWTVSERLRGGVAGAVAVHAASNGANGLFLPDSAAAVAIETAATAAIAAVLYLLQRGGIGVANPAATHAPMTLGRRLQRATDARSTSPPGRDRDGGTG